MAPTTRNHALAKKIATLQLRLSPLVPLPGGPPHPDFPRTLMDFHLLTEEQLDSIAHYYHQSTPGPWSLGYPASMNWDKEYLASGQPRSSASAASPSAPPNHLRWLDELMDTVAELRQSSRSVPGGPREVAPSTSTGRDGNRHRPFTGLSDTERVRIKRRKVGKFIGLVGMDTPVEEIADRLQAHMELAVQRSRAELQRAEEMMQGRRKVG